MFESWLINYKKKSLVNALKIIQQDIEMNLNFMNDFAE